MPIRCPATCGSMGLGTDAKLLPLTETLKRKYSRDLRKAWETLDRWFETGSEVSLDVLAAYRKLASARIPGKRALKGDTLCPLFGMEELFTDVRVAIPENVFKKYSAELKQDWGTVEKWWKTIPNDGSTISMNAIPYNVKLAYFRIRDSAVPGTAGKVFGRETLTLTYMADRIVSC